MNPFEELTALGQAEDTNLIRFYERSFSAHGGGLGMFHTQWPPHVYAVAAEALQGLVETSVALSALSPEAVSSFGDSNVVSRCICINGESGSGKTEVARGLLKVSARAVLRCRFS